MSDAPIDTSDIPEADEGWFKRARLQMRKSRRPIPDDDATNPENEGNGWIWLVALCGLSATALGLVTLFLLGRAVLN